jgi:hypothetical protein
MSGDPVVKCVRAVVTLIYSDNSSMVVDIKDPQVLVTELDNEYVDERLENQRNITSLEIPSLVFRLAARIDNRLPTTFSTYPVELPEEKSDGV